MQTQVDLSLKFSGSITNRLTSLYDNKGNCTSHTYEVMNKIVRCKCKMLCHIHDIAIKNGFCGLLPKTC